MNDIFSQLKAPFPHELISWRVGATNKNKNNGKATKGIALAYIDARDVMERLDKVVGPGNWQNEHPHANGKTSCRIGIKIGSEWIWKENGAGDSAMDAEKGAFSDSFKRAAVLWGIGQYLYNVPNIWVELNEWGQIANPQDTRLFRALREAEQGIRGKAEEEPKEALQVMESKELDMILDEISQANSPIEFQTAREKANAARPRMTKDQQVRVGNAVKSRNIDFPDAPLPTVQHQGAVQ
jgi:hypothetical protein